MKKSTSWEPVEKWYRDLVGKAGHTYHREVIFPKLMKIMDLEKTPEPAVLDLACGQGILSFQIPKTIPYWGVDIAPSLVADAKKQNKNPHHHFIVGDVCKPLKLERKSFSHVTIILAIQNMEDVSKVFRNANSYLIEGGKLIIILNHPCFRIPRQSSWEIDQKQKVQFRRIDRYLSEMNIPILAKPSLGSQSEQTLSFHHPISSYSRWLKENHFTIELIEEWCSNKVSTGGAAKMENRARNEIPLFMAIIAVKSGKS